MGQWTKHPGPIGQGSNRPRAQFSIRTLLKTADDDFDVSAADHNDDDGDDDDDDSQADTQVT